MKIRRWNPLDWFLGDWVRTIPVQKRLRFARRLGYVKWATVAAMVGLVAWQWFGGPSPQDAWRTANEPGYLYPDEGGKKPVIDAAEHAPDADDTSDTVHQAGFVVKYAESSLVEDWQTYAEQAFGHPAALVDLARRFTRIKAKTRIFVEHYEAFDPAFKSYFERTGLSAAASS